MYDLVILNGKVFNGNDEVSKKLNIGITNDKIMTITELPIEGKKKLLMLLINMYLLVLLMFMVTLILFLC